ncbi:hypothetical protein JW906_08760 [bacterium]|nr:hypothetical protein [bacterium]
MQQHLSAGAFDAGIQPFLPQISDRPLRILFQKDRPQKEGVKKLGFFELCGLDAPLFSGMDMMKERLARLILHGKGSRTLEDDSLLAVSDFDFDKGFF